MALKGSLLDMSLVDLLQAFGISGKTGRLMLEQAGKQGGILWVSKGTIANAATMDFKKQAVATAGEAAVVEMLQWEDATFRFIPATSNETYQRTISRSTEWLILEGLRRRDEQAGKSIYPQVSLDTKLRMVAHPSGGTKTLSWKHEEWQVLTNCAKTTTMAEIVAKTNFPESEVFGVIGRLMALRLVEFEPDEVVEVDYSDELVMPFVLAE